MYGHDYRKHRDTDSDTETSWVPGDNHVFTDTDIGSKERIV